MAFRSYTPETDPPELTPASTNLLEKEIQRLNSQWFYSFGDPVIETIFVKMIIVRGIKASILKWWAFGTVFFIAFEIWHVALAGSFDLIDFDTRATIFLNSMRIIQMSAIQTLLVVHFVRMPSKHVDVVVLLAGLIVALMVFTSNRWKAGIWFANDGCFFHDNSSSCPNVDTNDIYMLFLVILTYLGLAHGMPVRAGCLLYFAIFAPVSHALISFPRGWSPHSTFDVAVQTLILSSVSGALWVGRRRAEFQDRVDWLRGRAFERQVTDLLSKTSPTLPGAEVSALNRLQIALRWENSEDVRLAHKDLEGLGWTQTDIVARERAIRKHHSETFGVSVSYLLSEEFTHVAQRSTGLDDPSFYDISEALFMGDNAIGRNVSCPRDGRGGCSYLDTLAPEHKGPCTHFLSWTWAYSLTTLQSALRGWICATNKDPADTNLWMCFFVNNQHRILNVTSKVRDGSDNLEEVFEANLMRIGKLVALLDNWMDSIYLGRIWCIFEQFMSIKLGIEVSMILPLASAASVLDQIDKGKSGILFMKEQLGKVDSKSARASFSTDEMKVKLLIEQSVGFDVVDKRIIESLTKWMASEVQLYMKELVNDDPTVLSKLARGAMSEARRPLHKFLKL